MELETGERVEAWVQGGLVVVRAPEGHLYEWTCHGIYDDELTSGVAALCERLYGAEGDGYVAL